MYLINSWALCFSLGNDYKWAGSMWSVFQDDSGMSVSIKGPSFRCVCTSVKAHCLLPSLADSLQVDRAVQRLRVLFLFFSSQKRRLKKPSVHISNLSLCYTFLNNYHKTTDWNIIFICYILWNYFDYYDGSVNTWMWSLYKWIINFYFFSLCSEDIRLLLDVFCHAVIYFRLKQLI